MKNVGVHFRIDEDTKERVRQLAEEEHRSFSQQVRYLMELGLEAKKKRSDGMTDRRYLELVNSVRDGKE